MSLLKIKKSTYYKKLKKLKILKKNLELENSSSFKETGGIFGRKDWHISKKNKKA
nr:hypothetical protein [Mycoplasmopsis bovis]